MYDELVKRLRAQAVYLPEKFSKNAELLDVLMKAADAIEELSKYANAIRKLKCEGWYLQQTKYHDGYQAVSTMPLPEPPKEET